MRRMLSRLLRAGLAMAVFGVLALQAAPIYAATTSEQQSSTTEQQQAQAPETTNMIANGVCQGVLGTQNPSTGSDVTIDDCTVSNGGQTLTTVMKKIINMFSIVVGSVSVIMIIIGGFRYIISGGDSAGVGAAKNTILYAIVGLVIVIFSQIIVQFVISNLTNATKPTTSTSQTQTTTSTEQQAK